MKVEQRFAGRLRELRERAALSQKELAERVGLTVRQVSRLETEAQKPSWETVVALAEALGVDCRAFLAEPARMPEPKRGRPKKAGGSRHEEPAPKHRGGRPSKRKKGNGS